VATSETQGLGIPGWSVVNVAGSQNPAMRSLAAAPANARAAAESLAGAGGGVFASPVFTTANGEAIPSSEILVGLKAGATIQGVLTSLNNPSITGSALLAGSTYKLTTSLTNGVDVLNLANSLNGMAGIAFAEPNFIQGAKMQMLPSDPLFSQAWGLRNTGQSGGRAGFDMAATSAWDVTTGSSSVVAVVFECGIDPSHPDINATAGRDFTNAPVAGAGPRPTGNEGADNHGTRVAGCISGKANNGLGATGVAPGVRIASARIGIPTTGNSFSASSEWIVAALDWARSIGARVTNHSYSMGAASSAIDAALLRARNAGIVNVAATGNSNTNVIGYPASSPYCLGVGAANRYGARASFSNYGSGLDFLAPGEAIITTDRVGSMGESGDYATVNGTSFASPYAAGVAALIISRNPSWTAAQVEQRMKDTCTDMGATGYDSLTGSGLLNAYRALGGSATADDVGDTLATARTVSVPSTTSAAISRAGDIDMFKLTLAGRLELTAATSGSTDTFGSLYDASGSLIATNDNANGGYNFSVVRTLLAGTYYVAVRHQSSAAASGSYSLLLSSRAPQEPEIRIRGNGYEIVKGDTTPSTADFTSFGSVNAGSTIDRVFTIENSGVADLRMTGSPVVAISGTGASQFSVAALPLVTVSPARSTTFTVRFRPASAGTFNATISIANNDYDENPYTFAISGTGAGLSDSIGGTFATAAAMSAPGSISTRLDFGGDADMFRFTLSASATVTLATSGSTDTYGTLYSSTGGLITSDDDGNGYPNFRIVRTLAAGTYYLKVNGYSSTTTGAYSLTLSR
jgi:subtilisin family serine protease